MLKRCLFYTILAKVGATFLVGCMLIVLPGAAVAAEKEITDMFGRKYAVPGRPKKIFSASPPNTYLLYAVDPTVLVGLNFPIKEKDAKFFSKSLLQLPIVGGTFGEASVPNQEILMKVRPELIIVSDSETALSRKANESMKKLNLPMVELTLEKVSDYPQAFLRMGRILGREARARKLSDYCRKNLEEASVFASGIPRHKKVRVYYAEGVDGLKTECSDSRHTEPIILAGGINVHQCKAANLYGMEQVSIEQVLVYDPDVILAMDKTFYRRVFKDSRWRNVRAVKTGKVFLIPSLPINWFDRPPTFMRFIVLKWLMKQFYPKEYKADIVREAREFYRVFLGIELSNDEMIRVITP